MRLAFLDLPDERVDLISLARGARGVEIVLVAHPDPNALALKVAGALRIPRSTEPLDLLALKPDRVALPSLEAPSAAALARAGISDRIFTTLEELAQSLASGNPGNGREESDRAVVELDTRDLEPADGPADSRGAPDSERELRRIEDALELAGAPRRVLEELLRLSLRRTGAELGAIRLDGPSEGPPRIQIEIAGRERNQAVRPARARRRTTLSAPIGGRHGVMGTVEVSSGGEESLDDADLAALEGLAERMAGILGWLDRSCRRDADSLELSCLRAIDEVFDLENESVLERFRLAADALARILGAQVLRLLLPDRQGSRFTILTSGTGRGSEGSLPMGPDLVARVYDRGDPVTFESPTGMHVLVPVGSDPTIGVLEAEGLARATGELENPGRLLIRIASHMAAVASRSHSGEDVRQTELLARLASIGPRFLMAHDLVGLLNETVFALRSLRESGLVTARLRAPSGEVLLKSSWEGDPEALATLLDLDRRLAVRAMERGAELTSLGSWAPADDTLAEVEVDYIAIPIRSSGHAVGALGALVPARATSGRVGEGDLAAVRSLARFVELAWERIHAGGTAEPPRLQDSVTGLLGGAGLEARVQEEVKRADRYHDRFLLTLCSLSGFDRLADRHGAAWAERLLREFGRVVTRNVREVDAVARIEGGRFAVLSPQTDKDGGALLTRLDQLLPGLEALLSIEEREAVRLVGRQYTYPDEVPTGGELLALVRSAYAVP